MIVRKGQPEERVEADGPQNKVRSRRISEAGGLTQFGAYVHTLEPGARSSDRHWHEQEDEFLYVLSGEVTIVDNDGTHSLLPGDAACWAKNVANAHHVLNQSQLPCSYLICGTRVSHDVVHYPELGRVLHINGNEWRIIADDGKVIKQGKDD